jgi:uncharacterized membrane protein
MSWIVIVILLFWVGALSSRVSALEARLKGLVPLKKPEEPKPAFGINETDRPLKPAAASVSQAPVNAAELATGSPTDSNILARIGVVALVLGLGFFFKYSIDQGWINEWTRVLLGMIVSGLMILLGVMWKEKYGVRAEILSGGGVAVGFFSIYAGYSFYGLYNYLTAISTFVVWAALSVSVGFVKNFRSLASLGVLGAFFAPLFFGLKFEQQTFLMVYLALLSAGLLILFFFKQWLELPVLSLVANIFVFGSWVVQFPKPETNLQSWIFSTLLLLVYSLGVFINVRVQAAKNKIVEEVDLASAILVLLSAIQFLGYSRLLLFPLHPELQPWAAVLGAIFLLLGYVFVDRLELRNLNFTTTFCAAIMLLAAIFWQIKAPELEVVAILGLSSFGFAVGMMQKREEIRIWSLLLVLIAVGKSMMLSYATTDEQFLLNAKLGLTLLSTFVLMWFAWIYKKYQVTIREESASNFLLVISVAVVWFAVTLDIVNAFGGGGLKNTRNLLMSLWWAILAVGALVFGGSVSSHGLKQVSLLLFTLTIAKVFLYDVWALDLVYRIVAFIVLGVILLSVSFGYNQNKEKIIKLFE